MVQAYKDVILLGVDKLVAMFVIMSINDVMSLEGGGHKLCD